MIILALWASFYSILKWHSRKYDTPKISFQYIHFTSLHLVDGTQWSCNELFRTMAYFFNTINEHRFTRFLVDKKLRHSR